MNDVKWYYATYIIIPFASLVCRWLPVKPKLIALNCPIYRKRCDWWLLSTCVYASQHNVPHKRRHCSIL